MNIQSIMAATSLASGAVQASSASEVAGTHFFDMVKSTLRDVDALQASADQAIVNLVVNGDQSLHQTMISMEKADLAFQLVMQVRNKVVSAYEEIIRMQI